MNENRFEVKFDRLENRICGNTGQWCNWRKACSDFRDGSYGYIDDLCNEWFVIFDDIGAEQDNTGFIASAIDRIMAARQDKWTMITSNLRLQEIADKIDTRVASRMLRNNGVVVESKAEDYLLNP